MTMSAQPNDTPLVNDTQLRASQSAWFAADPSKAYFERISLVWAPLSMLLLLAGVFGTPLYKYCDRNSFLAISLLGCLPGFVIPVLFPCDADRGRPYAERFWVKAAVWIFVFGFYGNYFWTHYFYQLLGAEYLFDSYRLNDVPVVTFICTYFYFTFYFSLMNVALRRVVRAIRNLSRPLQSVIWWSNVFAFAYSTAVFEAVSIQHFPLYTYTERNSFLLVGSVVYGIYFVVGFPMFFSLDEQYKPSISSKLTAMSRISLSNTAMNAFAATAIVTLLLDLWRLALGSIYELGQGAVIPVPFIYQMTPTPMPTPVIEEPALPPSFWFSVKEWAVRTEQSAAAFSADAWAAMTQLSSKQEV